jgi:hypothetical protein
MERFGEHHPEVAASHGVRAADRMGPGGPDPSEPPGRAREVGAQFPDRYRRVIPPHDLAKHTLGARSCQHHPGQPPEAR